MFGIGKRLSEEIESATGVSFHQSSHTSTHGLLGLAGYEDESHRNYEAAYAAWEAGQLTESELGYACETWHLAEEEKSALRYALGW